MKKPKHVNPKIFLHKVYTEEGGVKEHNKNQQAVGALKLAGAVLIATKLLLMLDKVEGRPIKALKERRGFACYPNAQSATCR